MAWTADAIVHAPHIVARAAGSTDQAGRPPVFKFVGIALAVSSGVFIGTSFVLKKMGLLKANKKYNEEAGEGYGYLRNAWWWGGMTLMIIGEICNFAAYAFVDALMVTPLGALSVVITTILSAIFLKERLSFVGKVGCFNCIVGSVVIVLNAPAESAVADIRQMQDFVITPGFLTYTGIIVLVSAFVALWVGPRYGKKSMMVYISICSMIGGLSVVCTQGLGAAIVAQAGGKPQFNGWFIYVLLGFVLTTLVVEILYLNKALNLFNAALVTPTYYVCFTSATIVTSAILFRGFKGTPVAIASVVMGFLQICTGVILLQMSNSAKDVPDAAVFKGDLDQVREIAEQEQPESEPKADAIRGTAAIMRRMSTPRQKREEEEARRIRDDRKKDSFEPVAENEVVEWDGLRRRKTTISGSVPSPLVRQRTIHPPLGMSRFPDEHEHDEDQRHEGGSHRSFLGTMCSRASSVLLSPLSNRHNTPPSRTPTRPVALGDLESHAAKSDAPIEAEDAKTVTEHIRAFSPGQVDGQAPPRPPTLPAHLGWPPPSSAPEIPLPSPLRSGNRRQFSFQNIFRGPKSPSPGQPSPQKVLPPPPPSRGRSWHGSPEQKRAIKSATEEERLGLVQGDSNSPLLDYDLADSSSPDRGSDLARPSSPDHHSDPASPPPGPLSPRRQRDLAAPADDPTARSSRSREAPSRARPNLHSSFLLSPSTSDHAPPYTNDLHQPGPRQLSGHAALPPPPHPEEEYDASRVDRDHRQVAPTRPRQDFRIYTREAQPPTQHIPHPSRQRTTTSSPSPPPPTPPPHDYSRSLTSTAATANPPHSTRPPQIRFRRPQSDGTSSSSAVAPFPEYNDVATPELDSRHQSPGPRPQWQQQQQQQQEEEERQQREWRPR